MTTNLIYKVCKKNKKNKVLPKIRTRLIFKFKLLDYSGRNAYPVPTIIGASSTSTCCTWLGEMGTWDTTIGHSEGDQSGCWAKCCERHKANCAGGGVCKGCAVAKIGSAGWNRGTSLTGVDRIGWNPLKFCSYSHQLYFIRIYNLKLQQFDLIVLIDYFKFKLSTLWLTLHEIMHQKTVLDRTKPKEGEPLPETTYMKQNIIDDA